MYSCRQRTGYRTSPSGTRQRLRLEPSVKPDWGLTHSGLLPPKCLLPPPDRLSFLPSPEVPNPQGQTGCDQDRRLVFEGHEEDPSLGPDRADSPL